MSSTTTQTAFDQARSPLPTLPTAAEEHEQEDAPGATDLALRLLHEIAEDWLLRPSQHVRARRYLRKLQEAEAEPA